MCPVNEGQLLPEIILGHGLIGDEHEILNDLGGGVSLIRMDIHRNSPGVQNDLRFRKIKINGSPFSALVSQNAGQRCHMPEHGYQFFIVADLRRIFVLQNLFHTGVRHPLIHPHHGRCNPMFHHLSLAIDGHDATQRQPVLPRVQGTDAVGQLVGQHGDHPIHQINAGAPLISLPVKSTALLDIIAHIRNVHAQRIQAVLLRQGHGVIQILGILTVDGHHLPVPQIQPPCHICTAHHIRCPLRLVHHLFRKCLRQIISPDNGKDVHARIVDVPQNLCHPALRVLIFPVTIIRDLHHHLMAGDSAHAALQRDKNVPGDLQVVRDHKPIRFISLKGSHQRVDATLQHPDDPALPAPSALAAGDLHFHHILMQGILRCPLGNINVVRLTFHRHKPEAPGIACIHTLHQLRLRLAVFSTLGQRNLSFLHKKIQHLLQFSPLLPGNAQKNRHLLHLHGHIMFIIHQAGDHIRPLPSLFFRHSSSFPSKYAIQPISYETKNTLARRVLLY